jgi:predicted component of type VI protein secretion system
MLSSAALNKSSFSLDPPFLPCYINTKNIKKIYNAIKHALDVSPL